MDIGSGHHHAQWPAGPVDQDALLAPSLPRSVGLRPIAPPPNALFPWSNRPTAIPSLRRPIPGILRSGQPRCHPVPHALPNAEGPVDGAVIPQFLGQVVPLAGTAHTKDDPFQHLALVHPLRPFALGGSNSKIIGSIRSHRPSDISHIVGRVSLFPIIHHHMRFPYLNRTPYVFSLSDQSCFEIVT